MRIFETFFVVIAQQYIKIWKKYHYWAVGVRYFMALIFLCNITLFFLIIEKLPSIETFMFLLALSYLFIQFYKTSINTKEFVEGYEVSRRDRVLVMSYVLISIVAVVALFLIKVVYK